MGVKGFRVCPAPLPAPDRTVSSCAPGSNSPAAAKQLENEHHKGDQQQEVDVPGHHVESNKSDRPKDQQNYKECPEHLSLSSRFTLATV
jgi:hypothetical protein